MWVFPGFPYTLGIAAVGISAVLYWLTKMVRCRCRPKALALANFLCIYFVILGSIAAYEWYLDAKLESFDVDGDGIFSPVEATSEQREYMSRKTNDAGRSLAPVTGFLFSAAYSAIYLVVLRILEKSGPHRPRQRHGS